MPTTPARKAGFCIGATMANDILKTLIAEAIGEGPEGMRLVAETILNRAQMRGLTPEEVVRQPKQYTGLNNPGPAAKRAWDDPEALAAAEAAWQLAQQPGDPTGGADHYYAQGTINQPWWAKGMTPKGEMGGHTFMSSRPLPPDELPQVASALSTVPTPRSAPAPVTPSIDMAQMRRGAAPSQLIPDTFARLSRPARNLGDELAMSPIQGGKQTAPLFDAAYDLRTGEVRLTREPIESQGIAVGRSNPPAPVPRMPSPQLAAQRATDPVLQAALNARYPAQLPPLPAPRAAMTASDRVRGNPMQTMERATTIASIPTGFPTDEQIAAGTGFRPAAPDRLPAGLLPPALYGGNVAGIGTAGVAPIPFSRPPAFPTQVAARKVAPVPFSRPMAVGTALSVQPMPPMPIARPGIGGPFKPAPVPATMSPQMAARRAPPTSRGQVILAPESGYGSKGGTTIISPGGQTYDRTTGTWI
jgi:hypothetical protein